MLDARSFCQSDTVVAILRVADACFVSVNPAFERVTGWSAADVLGKTAIEIGLWPDNRIRAVIWGRLRVESRVDARRYAFFDRHRAIHRGLLSCEMFEQEGQSFVLCLMQAIGRSGGAAAGESVDVESYRSLFLEAAEGIYRSLPEGGFVDVNPALARIFGYESAAAMLADDSRSAASYYADPAEAVRVHQELDREGRIVNWRSLLRRIDGGEFWALENARAVRADNGQILFYEGTVVDISAQLAADAALRESEALYRTLVDNISDGVFLLQRGRLIFANQALARIFGTTLEDLKSRDYIDFVAPEFKNQQDQRRRQREAGSRDVFVHELGIKRADGSNVLLAVRSAGVEYQGAVASTGVVREITEERAQQRALQAAEAKYREIFTHSPVGLFQSGIDGKIIEVNQRLADMLGYARVDDMRREVDHMLALYPDPEERATAVAFTLRAGRVDSHQAQVRRRDGSLLWVQIDVRVIRGDDGAPLYFEGSVQNVQGRREAELALQRSEAKHRALVEHAQVGVFMMDADRLGYVNHAFAAMLGWAESELIERNFRELIAPEALAVAEERFRSRQAGRVAPMEYESCLLHRNGSRVYVTVSAGPIEIDGETLLMGTARDITRHRQAEQRLRFNATHDPLTGLPNRLLFQESLDRTLVAARGAERYQYAVLFLDLDGFKLVNDSLGHAAGDRLLVAIAEKLSVALAGEALVARYGGDEFTILPHGDCDAARAVMLAERILGLFNTVFDIGASQVFSGSSVGIVLGRAEYRSPDQVLRDADTAMYRAKARGKAGYVIFDEAMHSAARLRFQTETDLRLALERNEFRVYYQPIVWLEDGRIVACEALVRWQHPTRGLLLPAEFLPIAEEAGLISQIDWWVMEEASHQLARWQRAFVHRRDLRVNINVDEKQLSDRDFSLELAANLKATGVAPEHVSLEITETIFRTGRGQAGDILRALKSTGVHLVVDDFGTGYSSLDSFAASPFDALKVDRSFVQDMESNRRHLAIVRTITGFADDLGLALTAEGVETVGQARLLRDMGCASAQGNLYASAMSAEAMTVLLAETRGLQVAV